MINKIYVLLQILVKNCLMFIFWLFPVKKKIFVTSYFGNGYGDNPKYIIEELLKYKHNFKIVWGVNKCLDKSIFPKEIIICQNYSLAAAYHMATSKVWIDNCRKFPVIKRKTQIYIQTWHGFALKRIERDVEDHLGKNYVKFAKIDSKNINLIISDSKFMTNIYRNSFWYKGEIVEWGSPRNDILIKGNESIVKKVYNYFNIPCNKKIILYAPTFRVDGSLSVYQIDYELLIQSCEQKFNSDFIVLVRLHPNIANKSKNLLLNKKVMNATMYPDMQELLLSASVCVSDYSSLMFDFALSKKPCFQYALDIDTYKNDRNFYFDLSELPFPLCKSNEELKREIIGFDYAKYYDKLNKFFDRVGMNVLGKACKLSAEYILEIFKECSNE